MKTWRLGRDSEDFKAPIIEIENIACFDRHEGSNKVRNFEKRKTPNSKTPRLRDTRRIDLGTRTPGERIVLLTKMFSSRRICIMHHQRPFRLTRGSAKGKLRFKHVCKIESKYAFKHRSEWVLIELNLELKSQRRSSLGTSLFSQQHEEGWEKGTSSHITNQQKGNERHELVIEPEAEEY